jgi:vacuolar-type H+-ATPase subunit E/Vma4
VSAEAEAAAHRTLARTKAEALQSVLGARRRFLERVRAVVETRIAEAAEDQEYLATLVDELRESVDRLPPGDAVVRAAPGLVSALTRASAEVPEVAAIEEVPEIGMGFVVRADNGRVEVDATLEARLEHAWPRLAMAVLAEAGT